MKLRVTVEEDFVYTIENIPDVLRERPDMISLIAYGVAFNMGWTSDTDGIKVEILD